MFTASEHFCLCVAEYEDASLSSWVNKERFQGYLQIDGFTLYELGETGGVCINSLLQNLFSLSSCILVIFGPVSFFFLPAFMCVSLQNVSNHDLFK